MKLRLHGHSVRLRLEQHEVQQFAETGRVEATTALGPGAALAYGLEASDAAETLSVRFGSGHLTLLVPTALANDWTQTDRISLEAEQPTDSGPVRLLVEKDVGCQHKPPSERDTTQPFAHLRSETS